MSLHYHLVALVQEAIEGWTHANWTHWREISGEVMPALCNGGDEQCSYCASVLVYVKDAHRLGRSAIESLEDRDLPTAFSLVTEAAKLERKWGDAPTWGPVKKALGDALASETWARLVAEAAALDVEATGDKITFRNCSRERGSIFRDSDGDLVLIEEGCFRLFGEDIDWTASLEEIMTTHNKE